MPLFTRRRHSALRNSKSAIRRPSRRPLFETLENRSLLAGFIGTPNDPEFAQQWMLNNTGQAGGVIDADIDALEAWSVTTGSMATVVAVLDSGIDYTDADLYLNIWLNEGEIPASIASNLTDADADGLISFRDLNSPANSSFVMDVNANGYIDGGDLLADSAWENGLDEDGNSRTDDLVGWDFHDNDNDPQPVVSGGIYQSHGTDQAKMIGALGNNGLAKAGINWQVRLIPVRIREAALVINNVSAAAGLDYAVASGAPISNNSWRVSGGGYDYSQEMYDAIERARQAGHLFIAGAGNDGTNNDVAPLYPASYSLDNVISATVVDASNNAPANYGLTTVHLGSSTPGGSSGSSSHTSGVAALLKSAHPHWTYSQIKDRILSTVDPLPSLAGKTVTGGRLNAANALGVAQFSISDATATEGAAGMKFRDEFVPAGYGGLDYPRGIVFGPDGNLYASAIESSAVLRYDGQTGESLGVFAQDSSSFGNGGLLFHGDYLYVARGGIGGKILRFDALTGQPRPAPGKTGAEFVSTIENGLPMFWGVVIGPDGHLYATAMGTDEVRKFDGITGASLGVVISAGLGGLDRPTAILIGDDGNFYVGSGDSDAVLRYQGPLSANPGAFIDAFVPTGSGGLDYMGAGSMAFAPDGDFYIASQYNHSVLRYDGQTGAFVEVTVSTQLGGLDSPTGIAFDPSGNLYVSSRENDRVLRYAPSSAATFTASISFESASPVTVNYTTANGSATSGTDFSAASGTITFAPGQTSRTILVQTLDDPAYEVNETFTINLTNPVGGVITDGQATGTIVDNDPQPTKFYVVDDGSSNKTFEYAATGSAIENYAINSGNSAPRGAASTAAGDKVWVVDANKKVYVYNTSGGLLGSWTANSLASNADVQGVTTNGTDVWIVDAKQDKVFKYSGAASRLSGSQSAASSFNLNSSNSSPTDLVTDGTSIWVLNNASTDKVFKYTINGTLVGSWTINSGGGSPTGITIDPASVSNIWIVDSSSDRIYQFNSAASRTSGSASPNSSFALAAGNTNPQGLADPPISGAPEQSTSSLDYALIAVISELDGLLSKKKRK